MYDFHRNVPNLANSLFKTDDIQWDNAIQISYNVLMPRPHESVSVDIDIRKS